VWLQKKSNPPPSPPPHPKEKSSDIPGGGSQHPELLTEKMNLNWNFQKDWGWGEGN